MRKNGYAEESRTNWKRTNAGIKRAMVVVSAGLPGRCQLRETARRLLLVLKGH